MRDTAELLRRELTSLGHEVAKGRWQPMDGGRTNSIWRITGDQGDFVCKLFQPQTDNPLFPNDPMAEVKALLSLAGHEIAPTLSSRFQTKFGTCLIYTYEPGKPWSGDPAPVARLLRRLHAMDPPKGLRVLPSGSEALWRVTSQIVQRCADVPAPLRNTPLAPEVPASAQRCFLHGDAVAGNILIGAGGARLIDWQCPAIGDPSEDLAVFLSPAMQHLYGGHALGTDATQDFLAAYGDPIATLRYPALKAYFHLRMAAYCLWKFQTGHADYLRAMALELDALERL